MMFMLSLDLCFIRGCICDLFVTRNDSWMSYKTFTRTEQNMFLPLLKLRSRKARLSPLLFICDRSKAVLSLCYFLLIDG